MIEPVSRVQSYNTSKIGGSGSRPASSGDTPFSMDQALAEESARDEGVSYDRSGSATQKSEKKESVKPESEEIFEKPGANAPLGAIDTGNLVKGAVKFLKDLWQKTLKLFENIWESKPLTDTGDKDVKTSGSADTEAISDEEESHKEDSLNYYRSKLTGNDQTDDDPSVPNDDFDQNIEMLEHIKPFEDKAIKDALLSGDDERFERIITRGGERHPAISSTLLTQYNAKGQIIRIDPSDENLILRGTNKTNRS